MSPLFGAAYPLFRFLGDPRLIPLQRGDRPVGGAAYELPHSALLANPFEGFAESLERKQARPRFEPRSQRLEPFLLSQYPIGRTNHTPGWSLACWDNKDPAFGSGAEAFRRAVPNEDLDLGVVQIAQLR